MRGGDRCIKLYVSYCMVSFPRQPLESGFFLSILSGKAHRTARTLRINGEESEMSHYRRVIGLASFLRRMSSFASSP
jgi:hypothetical protein